MDMPECCILHELPFLVFYCTGREIWLTEAGIRSFQVSGFSSTAKASVFSYFVY